MTSTPSDAEVALDLADMDVLSNHNRVALAFVALLRHLRGAPTLSDLVEFTGLEAHAVQRVLETQDGGFDVRIIDPFERDADAGAA